MVPSIAKSPKQLNKHQSFVYTLLNGQNNSIWPIDLILSGATTPDLSEPGSNGNEGVFHTPPNSRTGAELLDCLMS